MDKIECSADHDGKMWIKLRRNFHNNNADMFRVKLFLRKDDWGIRLMQELAM